METSERTGRREAKLAHRSIPNHLVSTQRCSDISLATECGGTNYRRPASRTIAPGLGLSVSFLLAPLVDRQRVCHGWPPAMLRRSRESPGPSPRAGEPAVCMCACAYPSEREVCCVKRVLRGDDFARPRFLRRRRSRFSVSVWSSC